MLADCRIVKEQAFADTAGSLESAEKAMLLSPSKALGTVQ